MDAKSWDCKILDSPKSPSFTELSSPRKTVAVSICLNLVYDGPVLTILGLQIPMKNHRSPLITGGLCIRAQAHDITASGRRVFPKMAAIQRAHNLAEDAPHELLLAHLVLVLEVSDDAPQIAVSTVLHVEMQVLGGFDVVPLEVGDDVRMSELLENGEFGL